MRILQDFEWALTRQRLTRPRRSADEDDMVRSNQPIADKIVAIALELIQETGNFDLPMRDLAARARVSLRTPYRIFGSKSGVINAILMTNQARFRTLSANLKSTDEIENIFDRVVLGIRFYAEDQPFYRALFRASQGAEGDGKSTAYSSDNLRSFQILSLRASRAGLLKSEADTGLVGETLSDIFASNLRRWAFGSFDITLVDLKIRHGFSMVLSSVTEPETARRLQARRLELQSAVSSFEPPSERDWQVNSV